MAELAVLSIISPMEMVKTVEANAVTLAIDPELEIQRIKEEELALQA